MKTMNGFVSETVNHPSHYQSEDGLEVIDVIKAFTKDISGVEAFCVGNAIKYICRYKNKKRHRGSKESSVVS